MASKKDSSESYFPPLEPELIRGVDSLSVDEPPKTYNKGLPKAEPLGPSPFGRGPYEHVLPPDPESDPHKTED